MLSSSSPLLRQMDLSFIKISEQEGGYAFVDLQRNPVNSMNLDFWEQLTAVLDSLEKNPRIRAMIIRSALEKNVFTAGNDLLELYAPKTSKERYTKFWVVQNKFLARLMISPLLTIAAVKGACPAVLQINSGRMLYCHVL